MPFTRFAVNSYESPALSLSAQRVVNARTVKAQQGSRTQTPVFRLPGIASFVDFTLPVRGASRVGTTLVVLSGTTVYSVSATGATTSLGTIPGVGITPTAEGVNECVFLADGVGYVVTTTVTEITDNDFQDATQVVWIDGYFFFLGTDRVFVSGFNDPLTYNALAYDSLTWATEQPIAIAANKRDLIHFMPKAMAIGYNASTTPYPFRLASDGFIDLGCGATRSPASLDNTLFWFASDRTVRALRGTTPVRVSTEPLEQLFARMTTVTDAFGLAISQDGSFSYILTFPSEGRTFEYNVATELWNERASYGQNFWQAEGHIEAYGKHFVWADDLLGYLDPLTYAEFGDPQVVELTSENLNDGVNWVHFDRIELDIDMGNGLIAGQGSDPMVVLEYSDDGGKTWSASYQRSVGKIGEFKKRAIFTRHGRSRSRVYRLRYSEPTPFAFLGAYVNEGLAA